MSEHKTLAKKILISKVLPHVIIVLGFLLLTMFFFSPIFFGGKQLSQGDIVAQKGASKELVDYRIENHEEALWTNSMFGGMPGFQISTTHDSNFIKQLEKPIRLIVPYPYTYLFLGFLCFYGLMLILGVNPYLAAVGALAFGFSSYNIQLFEAGHNTKLAAIAYMPMVLGGLILVFKRKYIFGGALFAFFLSLELSANHVQITYYLGILLLFVVVGYAIKLVREGGVLSVLKAGIALSVATVFALACNASLLWTTYAYKDHTIRGKSELTSVNDSKNATSGLGKSYITQWSYGKQESFTLLVPNFKGGASGVLKSNRKAVKKVKKQYRKTVQGMDKYFGGQPFTSGPVYLGAAVCLIFIVGFVFSSGALKWSLIGASTLALFLSWGKNFMFLTDFFIENIPLYNNFRAVSMTLVIVQLAIPVVAMVGLNNLLGSNPVAKDRKKVWISGGALVFLLLAFMVFPSSINTFFKPADPLVEGSVNEKERLATELKNYDWPKKQIEGLLVGLASARKEVFLADVQRSLLFVLIAWLLIAAFVYGKISRIYIIAGLLILVLVDLWSVDKRYLEDGKFVKKTKIEKPVLSSLADDFIVNKPVKGRVLNLAVNTFNDATTSYLHQSIGGYSAVKLRRYQELFDYSFSREFKKIKSRLSQGKIAGLFSEMHTLNMLNMTDVVYNPNAIPLQNEEAYGKAWLASTVVYAQDANQELQLTLKENAKERVVISRQEQGNVGSADYQLDSLSNIKLTSYEPNQLVYEVNLQHQSLIVFSEIFYKEGWEASIDGNSVDIARANFILRALEVPTGSHKIKFDFIPKSYYIGSKISAVSSGIILLLIVGMIYRRQTTKKQQA